jgi:gamma-glutamyltranspeptidase/glutathione hydrolase
VYQPQGNPLKAGDRLRQPALGDLLQFLADAEAAAVGTREQKIRAAHEAFYRGEVAEQIATWVQQQGGYLTANDLANFDADVSVGPQLQIGEWTFAATPSWSQGPVALELLGILSRTSGSWHEIAEATTLAFNDREDFFAAPGQMERNITDFLDPEYLAAQARRIQAGSALAGRTGERQPKSDGSALGSTTAVVTMDSSGLTFATSPSDTLDGGPIIPSLGIMCSPRGVQNRLDPNHPNRLRPGGRPMVTPAALIGMRGSDSWALACPGGDVIVQAMVQVIRRVLSENLDLQQAVEAPRIAAFNAPSAFHPHPSADRLVYAEARIGEAEIAKLREQGHNVEVWPDFEFDAGSVQTIMSRRNASGEPMLLSAADPRRSAYAISN